MGNMISIPESRYIELLEIEKKYKGEIQNKYSSDNILIELYYELDSIVNSVLLDDTINSWIDVYSKLFEGDDPFVRKWRKVVPSFSWYDPDSSYYDDVMAFYHAVQSYMVQNNILSETDI